MPQVPVIESRIMPSNPKHPLIAKTRILLGACADAMNGVAAYYAGHDCDVTVGVAGGTDGGTDGTLITVTGWHIYMRVDGKHLVLEVGAKSEAGVAQVKSAVIAVLQSVIPEADLDCRWHGAGQSNGKLPNFRELSVIGVTDLSPHMRRLRLAGTDLAAYGCDGIHVRLLIPPRGVSAPKWPTLAANGMPIWPEGEDAVAPRVYTIRRIDADAGWIDIDFVMHGDNGPGSTFARHAILGDRVGMTGPLGGELPNADWFLFTGDETALPAIGRYLEELPEHACGHAVIEVGSRDDIIALATKSRVAIKWVCRDDGAASDLDPIRDAISRIEIPHRTARVYCWAGVEQAIYKPIHQMWRKETGLDRDQCLAMTFWRKTA
ncbi:siderophore-interacting protein [Thalassospira alkalitolerans]|uniref:siderophore-interacting protein n=1 Tax=Thalassospira alkalitolerans TaxID=1293890 RepID=UPI003AA978B4